MDFAVSVGSAPLALLYSILALDLGRPAEAVVSGCYCEVVPMTVLYSQAKLAFCDIDQRPTFYQYNCAYLDITEWAEVEEPSLCYDTLPKIGGDISPHPKNP